MVEEKQKPVTTAEGCDDGGAFAGVKLAICADDLTLTCYTDGRVDFEKQMSRPEALTLAYRILGALRNGNDTRRES